MLILLIVAGAFAFTKLRPSGGPKKDETSYKVSRGDLVVSVIETGNIEAVKSVEVKSRVSGRLKELFVKEGDFVKQGQLIATIDALETKYRVEQDMAQLRGVESSVQRAQLEIAQRRQTVAAAYRQAEARVAQLTLELKSQPILTKSAITSAQTALTNAINERQRLEQTNHPTQRVSAKSAVDEAKANVENAKLEYDRFVGLEAKGYTAGRNVDSARLQLELAKSRLATANSTYEKLEAQLRSELQRADESVKQARADLERAQANQVQDKIKVEDLKSAQADLARAKATLADPAILAAGMEQTKASVAQLRSVLSDSQRQLGETQILAPMSGYVTKKLLEVGELATGLSGFSQGTPIVRIEDRSTMRVKLAINEIDVAKMKEGMAAQIDVDAIPNKVFSGVVSSISPASESSNPGVATAATDSVVKYKVEILISEADPRIRSGMSAKCTMDVIRRNNVIVVPVEYVVKDAEAFYVELPLKEPAAIDAKAERKAITVGASSGSQYEILTGLNEGDLIGRPNFTGPKRQGFMSGPGGGDDEDKDKDKGKTKSGDQTKKKESDSGSDGGGVTVQVGE
ncbi:MAG: HlyD family secretion protein [Fimbriimonas sp.]